MGLFAKYPVTAIAAVVVLGAMIVVLLIAPAAIAPASEERIFLLVSATLIPAFIALLATFRGEQASTKADDAATKATELAHNVNGRISTIENKVGIPNGQRDAQGNFVNPITPLDDTENEPAVPLENVEEPISPDK